MKGVLGSKDAAYSTLKPYKRTSNSEADTANLVLIASAYDSATNPYITRVSAMARGPLDSAKSYDAKVKKGMTEPLYTLKEVIGVNLGLHNQWNAQTLNIAYPCLEPTQDGCRWRFCRGRHPPAHEIDLAYQETRSSSSFHRVR